MKNKHIINSWDKIEPSKDARQRMLANILRHTQQIPAGKPVFSNGKKQWLIVGFAAGLVMIVVLTAFLAGDMMKNRIQGGSVQTVDTAGAVTKAPAETDSGMSAQTESSLPKPAIDGTPVHFSQLGLSNPAVEYPEDISYGEACLVAFREDMIQDSSMIVIGTVMNVRFNRYFDFAVSVVYELTVTDVLYAEQAIAPGDTLIIEQNLYIHTSIQDAVVGLKPGGTYLLPIQETDSSYVADFNAESAQISVKAQEDGISILKCKKMESPYRIIYPFMPPIQVVPEVGYLFPAAWKSLMTEDASAVIMDLDEPKEVLYGDLYLRNTGFIDDFKLLIGKYVNESYRAEHAHYNSNQYEIINGMVKTTSDLADRYAMEQMDGVVIINYSCIQEDSGEWAVSFTDKITGKKTVVYVPEYLPVPSESDMVETARQYLAEDYVDWHAEIIYDEAMNRFQVNFSNAGSTVIIRAELTINGQLISFSCFE